MKAILVFDINDLTYKGIEDGFINEVTLHLRSNGFYEIKDVELKPMPEKIKPVEVYIHNVKGTVPLGEESVGWNACIDEILGEEQ